MYFYFMSAKNLKQEAKNKKEKIKKKKNKRGLCISLISYNLFNFFYLYKEPFLSVQGIQIGTFLLSGLKLFDACGFFDE